MQALRYHQALPNLLGIVKEPWGAGKTYLDVVVTLLLLCQGKKVKVLSPSNKSSDTFIERLNAKLTRLREMGVEIPDKKVIRFHSMSTESRIVAVESSKNRENEPRQTSFQLCERKKYE